MSRKKETELPNFNFDEDKEFAVYKYACKLKTSRKEKKYIEGLSFDSYDSWRTRIEHKYQYVSLKSLRDFQRSLKNKKKIESAFANAYTGLFMPWLAVVITIIFDTATTNYADELNALVLAIISITTPVIKIGALIWIFKVVTWDFIMESKRSALYDDYIEIIGDMIKEKETTNDIQKG